MIGVIEDDPHGEEEAAFICGERQRDDRDGTWRIEVPKIRDRIERRE